MKNKYIEWMERALCAYTDEHIRQYFDEARSHGLREHGFPRLTANIGILIAHGKRRDLLPLFEQMMELCCKTIPIVKAANDFSVREIICCLWEIEKNGVVPKEDTQRWRSYLASISPTTCYNEFAISPADTVRNWALFTAVSEYFRREACLCDSTEFIELQLYQQLQWLDENGMYRDNAASDGQQPMLYDLVPRGLLALLLNQGYHGKYYAAIDQYLKSAGLLTLAMQSPNGEVAFGGRSNQFVFNEACLIAVLEYEAKRYAREGNAALSARFKAAAARALDVVGRWLEKEPVLHVKNRFPTESKYGCEHYAYFDKYMITVASNLYIAYLICDDSIPFQTTPDREPCAKETSKHFHKLFLKAGGYGLEFDTNADPHYDANGLGRIHRADAPASICLSCPCPSQPFYTVDVDEPLALSLCSAVKQTDTWQLGASDKASYEVLGYDTTDQAAHALLRCRFAGGKATQEEYTVSEHGVTITVTGEGEIGFVLPAFCFDGATHTDISADQNTLTVSYDGWICRYTTDGSIVDMEQLAANRNGHYRAYLATARRQLNVTVEIVKK